MMWDSRVANSMWRRPIFVFIIVLDAVLPFHTVLTVPYCFLAISQKYPYFVRFSISSKSASEMASKNGPFYGFSTFYARNSSYGFQRTQTKLISHETVD